MSNHITSIVVDDERAARDELEEMLMEYCPEVKVVAKASSAETAREAIAQFHPKVMFLDVKMPRENGFQLLKTLDQKSISVVFVTAFNKYAVEAFKASALHYLIKPCLPEELKAAVERVRGTLKASSYQQTGGGESMVSSSINSSEKRPSSPNRSNRIVVTHKTGFNVLKTSELLYLESSGNYTVFHTTSGERLTASRHLGFFETQLPQDQFLRIHRSFIINLDRIQGYESSQCSYVIMEDGTQLEISRRKLKDLLNSLAKSH